MQFQNDTLLIIPENKKAIILNSINKQNLINIKITNFNEVRDNLYFKYDEKTIHYLIKKYNIKYEIAKIYLDNIYFIEDKEYKIEKLDKLVSIKKELEENNLLIYNPLYESYLKTKKVIIYDFNILTKYQKNIIETLKKITNVEIYNENHKEYEITSCYNFEHIDDEISFVLEQISSLLKTNITNITLLNVSKEYEKPLKRLSKFYNINIENNTKLYETNTSNIFLKKLKESSLKEALEEIKQSKLYNDFLNICNKYIWCKDKELIDLITYDLKHENIKKEGTIKINSYESYNDYYFLLGFNSNYPRTFKDEEYIQDDLKKHLNIDTSYELNKINKENEIKNLKRFKHLTLTYKNKTNIQEYYPSILINSLDLKVIKDDIIYSKFSNLKNKIDLSKSLDLYYKYGHINENLKILNNYDLSYLKYNNAYKKIKTNLTNLNLSYSSIDNYYKCGFKFYLNNILKLNLNDNTFMLDIGNLFHYILSICFKENFDLEEEKDKYLKTLNKTYTNKELFFIEKLTKDLSFIIDTIKEQYKHIELNNSMYEKKVYLDKSKNIKITFSGIIDKVLYKEQNGYKYGIIIDYKTGSPSTSLDLIDYGINLQLPIYLYLLEENFDIKVIGLYYQKLLQSIPNRKDNYYKEKKNDLKLIGYTIDDEELISLIDDTYLDSEIIKGMKKSKNGFYAYTKLLNNDKLKEMKEIATKKIDEAITNIIDSNFDINPKKYNKETTCKNCIYQNICYREEKNYIYLEGENDELYS